MKLLKTGAREFVFSITRQEKEMLFRILDLYPVVPESHHRLSRTEDRPEDEKLLRDAMADERQQYRRKVQTWKRGRARLCGKTPRGRLTLKIGEMDWLLRVLNDVRIGSWLALGSPDGAAEILAALNEKTAVQFWAMETAGGFQSVLLMALNGGA